MHRKALPSQNFHAFFDNYFNEIFFYSFSFFNNRPITRAVKMVISAIFQEWPDLETLEALVDMANISKCIRKGWISKRLCS